MKTSGIAVETSRSISQSDAIERQTNKRSFLSDTTMNNIHIFNDNFNDVNDPSTEKSCATEVTAASLQTAAAFCISIPNFVPMEKTLGTRLFRLPHFAFFASSLDRIEFSAVKLRLLIAR